jgi:histidine phosphotransferase ChpT
VVTRSAERRAGLVAVFRAGVGAAGAQAGFGLADAQLVIGDALAGGKVVLDWPEERQSGPLGAAKLVLNLILSATEMLPRGGGIAVRTSLAGEFAVTVTASGAGARLTPEIEIGLDPDVPAEKLTTRSIQAHFTAHLCRRKGGKLRIVPGTDQVTLSTQFPV